MTIISNGSYDASVEQEFGLLLDRVQRGVGYCNAEPDRTHIADTWVASWQASSEQDTLLEWAEATVTACGG